MMQPEDDEAANWGGLSEQFIVRFRLRSSSARSAPAASSTAGPDTARRTTAPMAATGLDDWCSVLRLRLDARSTGRLVLRVRDGHRAEHEYGSR